MIFSVAQSWLSSFGPAQVIFLCLLLTGVKPVQKFMGLAEVENGLSKFAGFSFGWFLYSIYTLLYSLGITTSPNATDSTPTCFVVNPRSKHPKQNKSVLLSRLFRDYSAGWINKKTKADLRDVLKESNRPQAGLCVAIYQATGANSKRFWDLRPTTSLIFAAVAQLTIAAAALVNNGGSLRVLIVVLAGIILSSASSSTFRSKAFPRKQDKKTKDILLTSGQGSQHAILIKGHEGSYHLEDLANGVTNSSLSAAARVGIFIFSIGWLALFTLLLTLDKRDAWALVAVGVVGWVQNLYIASGKKFGPHELGLGTLVFQQVVVRPTVKQALDELIRRGERDSAQALQNLLLPGDKDSSLETAPLAEVVTGRQ